MNQLINETHRNDVNYLSSHNPQEIKNEEKTGSE